MLKESLFARVAALLYFSICHLEVVKLLLELGWDHDLDPREGGGGHQAHKAIHAAADKGYVGIVKLLLEYGVEVSCKTGTT